MAKVMLKRFAILLFFSCLGFSVKAQSKFPAAVFIEAGGSGGFASVNFDKGFFTFKNGFLSGRIGVGYFQGEKYFGNSSGVFVIPTIVNCMLGKSPNWLETGFGLSLGISTKPSVFSRIAPTLGYRYQKSDGKGIFFRITYTPILPSGFGDKMSQWAGISFGYSFASE